MLRVVAFPSLRLISHLLFEYESWDLAWFTQQIDDGKKRVDEVYFQ